MRSTCPEERVAKYRVRERVCVVVSSLLSSVYVRLRSSAFKINVAVRVVDDDGIQRTIIQTGAVALEDQLLGQAGQMCHRQIRTPPHSSSFAGFRYPPEVTLVAVRWYLRYALSYWNVEKLMARRGIKVDHIIIYRWVQRFTPLLIDAARPCRHAAADRWFTDQTDVKVADRWLYFCTGRSTSTARSSTYWCRRSGTRQPLAGSLPGLSITAPTRAR